jgi:hypothetical protein
MSNESEDILEQFKDAIHEANWAAFGESVERLKEVVNAKKLSDSEWIAVLDELRSMVRLGTFQKWLDENPEQAENFERLKEALRRRFGQGDNG